MDQRRNREGEIVLDPHMRTSRSRRSIARISLILLAAIAGCGASEKKFIPSADTAQAALEAGLEKWKSGDAHGAVTGLDVDVNFQDARWQAGKKLESYEIVREEKSEGPRLFIVKMKLNGEQEETEQKFFVVGKDPLHVFAEKDYAKVTGTG